MKGSKCRPSPRPPRLSELDAEEEKALERARGGQGDHPTGGAVLEVPVSSDAEAAIERAWEQVQEDNVRSPDEDA